MFLDVWREKRIKRNLDEAIKSYSGAAPVSVIKRIGVIIDTTAIRDAEELTSKISEIQPRAHLASLSYVERVNKKEFNTSSSFDSSAINWLGELSNPEIEYFLSQEFDLLINYYAQPHAVLQLVTARTKADFKVGLTLPDDTKLNDLTIGTRPENITVFCQELKNYLRILKRID